MLKEKQLICKNLDNQSKEKLRIAAKKRMETVRENKKESRDKPFDEVMN